MARIHECPKIFRNRPLSIQPENWPAAAYVKVQCSEKGDTIFIWLEARLQPNIGNTLGCVSTVFTRSVIKWHLGPCSRLATTDVGQKLGASAPFWGGGLGPHLTQSRLG